jgi:hypothetical protein
LARDPLQCGAYEPQFARTGRREFPNRTRQTFDFQRLATPKRSDGGSTFDVQPLSAPMMRYLLRTAAWLIPIGLSLGVVRAPAQTGDDPLLQRGWFEARTAHFNIYSCGAPREVNGLAARLEQFCEAYTLLAGAKAVASPPIDETVPAALPGQTGESLRLLQARQR